MTESISTESRQTKNKTVKGKLQRSANGSVGTYLSIFAFVCSGLVTQISNVRQLTGSDLNRLLMFAVRREELLAVRKMAELKQALAPGTTVGYLSNIVKDSIRIGWVERPKAFYVTQYALAPIIVDYSTDHSLVVGYFDPPLRSEVIDERLDRIRDFDNGVVLFRKK